MNERQKSLHKYLQSKSTTNRFITKEEICTDLPRLYPRQLEKTTEHNSVAYNNLRRDVQRINQDGEGMIIASSNKGYKIATPGQAQRYLERYKIKQLKGLKRYWTMLEKAQENGQLAMTEDGTEIVKRMLEEAKNVR